MTMGASVGCIIIIVLKNVKPLLSSVQTCRTRLEQKGGVHVKSFGVLGRAVEMFIEGFVRRGTIKVGFIHGVGANGSAK